MAVNKISMGINYRKKTNSRMTGSGNYFAEREQARPEIKDWCIANVAKEYADLQPK